MFVSLLSGAGSFLHQRRTKRHKKAGWLVEMITELVMAVTAGLAALFVGWWQVFPPPLTCLIALIAASNGAAFMELGRKFLTNKIENGGRNG
jgi:hypothetical protein